MEVALAGLRDRGYAPEVVYDVGASDGSWTRLALSIWPEARVVCFEPLAERHRALEALAAEHPGRISVQPFGIADTEGALSLGVSDSLWESSFAYPGPTQRTIAVHRLDTLLDEGAIPPASFVKIDVQGFELRVIAGGPKALRDADFILAECSFFSFCEEMRTLDETIAFMSARGFVPYEFADFLRRPLDGAMGQCDILFARRTHRLRSDPRWAR
jgi:FkbM family methyltransferase